MTAARINFAAYAVLALSISPLFNSCQKRQKTFAVNYRNNTGASTIVEIKICVILGGMTFMTLENKLNLKTSAELAYAEEKISKAKARNLFKHDLLKGHKPGTFTTLAFIHKYLFEDIYSFAGKMRTVNIAKGSFRFVPSLYLSEALTTISNMPQKSFDQIIEKYVEMNVAHPFREGNGRATRIWLDHILKVELKMVIDWSLVNKEDYLLAMERSPIKDTEIKLLLKSALTDRISDREVYMKGIDASYNYEGYNTFKTEDL